MYSQYVFLYIVSLCTVSEIWLVKKFLPQHLLLSVQFNGRLYRLNIALFCTKTHDFEHNYFYFTNFFSVVIPRTHIAGGTTTCRTHSKHGLRTCEGALLLVIPNI